MSLNIFIENDNMAMIAGCPTQLFQDTSLAIWVSN